MDVKRISRDQFRDLLNNFRKPKAEESRIRRMRDQSATALVGGVVGMATMYVIDATRDDRRRALMRDKLNHWRLLGGDAFRTIARDAEQRAKGVAVETRHMVGDEQVDDVVLEQRVRAKMGRVVSHPHAVDVHTDHGRVTLSGAILDREVDQAVSSIDSVRGVKSVENRLDVHKQSDDHPQLQGGRPRPGDQMEFMQENWSPSARFLASAAGGTAAVVGLRQRSLPGAALAAAGMTLAARGITNLQLKRLLGVGGGRRGVDVHKTINVDAPINEVYDFWTNFEQYPRFMSHIHKVTDNGQGQLHWVVDGPPGVSIGWDAEATIMEPDKMVAWKSLPSSIVEHAGIVRFQENPDNSTRVQIHMTYNPPAGAIGHAIVTLMGRDPNQEMDDDLVRFKSLIEEGKTTAHGETTTRDEVMTEHPGEQTSEQTQT